MMGERSLLIENWVKSLPDWSHCQLTALAGDASFRRYFRCQLNTHTTAILMDAPPPQENIQPFVDIAQLLAKLDVKVPNIYAQDAERGLLLLEDLGNDTLSHVVARSDEVVIDRLYRQALQTLLDWQLHPKQAVLSQSLPRYDAALLVSEMQLLPEWMCKTHCNEPLSAFEQSDWQQWMRLLSGSALIQPQVLVHRDYHSRNLMLLPDGQMAVIDFQDAVLGPITYDAVSLLRDAYIRLSAEQIEDWLRFYFLSLVQAKRYQHDDWAGFVRSFDWMGVQRHLKVLGIFARLYHRDGKDHYLKDLPLVLDYAIHVAKKYPELASLANWLDARLSEHLLS